MRKGAFRNLAFFGASALAAVVLLLAFPDKQRIFALNAWKFFVEMMSILPAVAILIGLFAVFVPKEAVLRVMGRGTGIKGMLLSIFVGALPTGPLYVAFPMASALRKKGARICNIVVFLFAWACIKVPQELVEFQFLGFRFMVARLVLTIVFAIIVGLIIERAMTQAS